MLENFELVSSLRAFVILYVLYHSIETLLLSQKFVKIPVFRPLAFSDIIGDVIMCYYTRNKVGLGQGEEISVDIFHKEACKLNRENFDWASSEYYLFVL